MNGELGLVDGKAEIIIRVLPRALHVGSSGDMNPTFVDRPSVDLRLIYQFYDASTSYPVATNCSIHSTSHPVVGSLTLRQP